MPNSISIIFGAIILFDLSKSSFLLSLGRFGLTTIGKIIPLPRRSIILIEFQIGSKMGIHGVHKEDQHKVDCILVGSRKFWRLETQMSF
jgi:hypothetical protein